MMELLESRMQGKHFSFDHKTRSRLSLAKNSALTPKPLQSNCNQIHEAENKLQNKIVF